MSTTSKLGADMTDEQILDMAKAHFVDATRISTVLSFARALLARQPAAIDKQEAAVTRDDVEQARDRILEQSKNSLFRSGVKICAGEILSPIEPCDKPPSGWTCSRTKGHEGPCAASLAAPSVEQDERGAFEAWFKVERKRPESFMWRVNESDAWGIWQVRAASTSANVAQGADSGECLSCLSGKCVTGKNCVALGRDSFWCGYCKDTGYLPDGNHCQWCAAPCTPDGGNAVNVAQGAEAVTANGKPASQYFRAGRNQGLQEALYACKREHLEEPAATADDIAYTNAIDDCLKAIGRLLAAQSASGEAE